MAHPASPRIEQLTINWFRSGVAVSILHPFYTPESLLSVLERLSLERLATNFRKRSRPAELESVHVRQAGLWEIFRASLFSIDKRSGGRLRSLEERFMYRHHARLASKGVPLVREADVVYARSGMALELFQEAQRLGIPTVLDYPIAHHAYSRKLMQEEAKQNERYTTTHQWSSWPNWVEHRLDEEIALADKIHVGSQFVADSFANEGICADRLLVEPYGVDIAKFSPSSQTPIHRPFRVLFVGQIGQRKGISYLLEGYAQFKKPDTELILVGNFVGPQESYSDYTHLYTHISHLPHWQLPQVYRTASVFVFPSLNEGLGLALVEAMASGLPVVVTDRGPSEIVDDGISGIVVTAQSHKEIADALEYLYSNPDVHRRLGQNARFKAEQLSWQNYSNRLLDQIRRVQHSSPA